MLYNFLQNFWTPIWVIGGLALLYAIPLWVVYRQGRYVLKHYPTRYQNQLTSSQNNRPFPFNLMAHKGRSPIINLPKIIEIAKQENDTWLAKSAKNLQRSFYFFVYIYLIILLYKLFFTKI